MEHGGGAGPGRTHGPGARAGSVRGVGLAILSLAAGLGAAVWGQTGSAGKADALRAAGAEQVVVGGPQDLAGAVPGTPTVVIDPLGGGFPATALGLLPACGRYVVFGTSAGSRVTLDWQAVYRSSLRVLGYSTMTLATEERNRRLALTLAALADGRMRIPVARRVPLERASGVFDVLGDREVVGKVVLDLGAS